MSVLLGCGGARSTSDGTGTGTGTDTAPMTTAGSSSGIGPTSTGSGQVDGTSSSGSQETSTTDGTTTGGDTTTGPPPAVRCDGGALTTDVLVPSEVYLVGAFQGECISQLVAHWSDANSAVSGFACDMFDRTPSIRPTDGRLLYTSVTHAQLREFHCDVCPIASLAEYPASPTDNDTILPTTCEAGGPGALAVLIAPDGSYRHQCFGSTWYDEDGDPIYEGEYGGLRHLGEGGLALTTTHVIELGGASASPIVGLRVGNPLTIRSDPAGGFFLVMRTRGGPELWHVGSDGVATARGTYPAPPKGFDTNQNESALDGCGNLFQLGRASETFEHVVLRRVLGGATEVVYNEADDPLLEVPTVLLTGP